jgi:hypothetical protein
MVAIVVPTTAVKAPGTSVLLVVLQQLLTPQLPLSMRSLQARHRQQPANINADCWQTQINIDNWM